MEEIPGVEHVINRNGYVIEKALLHFDQAKALDRDLVFMPILDEAYGKPTPVRLVKDLGRCIAVPPLYGLRVFGEARREFDVEPAAMTFQGTLDDKLDQPAVVEGAVVQLRERGAGILAQHTGAGKTVCALAIAAELGVKALVIVHKSILLEQWVERIKQFLPEARVGVVQSDTNESRGKDIVVGMLQSIGKRDYEALDDHGLLIFDECFPAQQAIMTSWGAVTLGALYAAWERGDALPRALSLGASGAPEYREITYAWQRPPKRTVMVAYGEWVIECTPEHRFLTTTGYVPACGLRPGDSLVACDADGSGVWAVASVSRAEVEPAALYDIEVAANHNFVLCPPGGLSGGLTGPVVHNCHHAPAAVFSQVMFKVNAPYVLGLSATPERKDGLTGALLMLLGNVFYRKERRGQGQVRVWTVRTRREHAITLNRAGKPCMVSLINTIVSDRQRTKLIVDVMRQLQAEGRSMLFLSDRRAHAEQVCAEFPGQRLFLGGQSKKQLQVPLTEQIVCSTFPLSKEGLDVAHIDTLIMATPKSDIVQIVGRILRGHNTQKFSPLIVDFVDANGVCISQYNKRTAYYRSCGFDCKT